MMKRMNVLTRKFITDNIKANNTVSSYPVRTLVPATSTDNTTNSDNYLTRKKNTMTKVYKEL